jgi:hypothetical protein
MVTLHQTYSSKKSKVMLKEEVSTFNRRVKMPLLMNFMISVKPFVMAQSAIILVLQ